MSRPPVELPRKLDMDDSDNSVFAVEQGNRSIIDRYTGFDGDDTPIIEAMVQRYNAHDAAAALSNALDAFLKADHNCDVPKRRATFAALLNAQQAYEKAAR